MAKLEIKLLSVGQLAANCYLVHPHSSKEALIIDPGDEADLITQTINALELKPVAIIATHGHFDHIMAVNQLKREFDIPFLVHPADTFLVESISQYTQVMVPIDPGSPPAIDSSIKVGKKVKLFIDKFQVIHTPGHTPGSVCIYHQDSQAVFVGDVLFNQGAIGRYDFEYGNYQALELSIRSILNLPPETTIYPGHGTVTSVKKECQHHPYHIS